MRKIIWQLVIALGGLLLVLGLLLGQTPDPEATFVQPVHGGSFAEGVVGQSVRLNPLLDRILKPDFKDLLPAIKERGYTHVLVVPIQFLADHLETLYDVGIAGREEAEASGLGFFRRSRRMRPRSSSVPWQP